MNPPALGAAELLELFGHFLLLSLLAVGGALATAPEMHRYIVRDRGWLDDAGFTASIALAQAAPGPNVIFVAVIGWNVAGAAGAFAALAGNLLPSTLLALSVSRRVGRARDTLAVRAFGAGMAPLVIGLLAATGWILTDPIRDRPATLALAAATAVVMARTAISPMWLIGAGAVLGASGWV
jgi:chromate transporter